MQDYYDTNFLQKDIFNTIFCTAPKQHSARGQSGRSAELCSVRETAAVEAYARNGYSDFLDSRRSSSAAAAGRQHRRERRHVALRPYYILITI